MATTRSHVRRAPLPFLLAFLYACASPAAQQEAHAPSEGALAVVEASSPKSALATDAVIAHVLGLSAEESEVQAHLEALCVGIGPRLTSSSNLQRAEEWARERFASWGLRARLETWGTFPVGFDRGPRSGGMKAPEEIAYDFTSDAWTPGTRGPVRGRAYLMPATEEQLAALPADLKGAWMVQVPAPPRQRPEPRPQAAATPPEGAAAPQASAQAAPPATPPEAQPASPQAAAPAGAPPGGERPAGQGRRQGGGQSQELARRIEAGLVERGVAGVLRPSQNDTLVHTSGRHGVQWDALPKLTRIVLRGDQHRDLLQRVQAGESVELEFDIDNRFVEGPVHQRNVIADLVGSEKPDEYVIVCGHLDSWDGALGVVDNGTGVATTLEAARLLAQSGARPKRTIRFILWSGEEQGLLGSAAYVRQNSDELARISAVLNHDGGTNYLSGLTVTPEMMAQMQQACAPVLELDPEMPFQLVESEGLPSASSSDHASFVRAGVPGFFWRQSGRSNYSHHHHTQFDTLDAAIPEYQRHSAKVVALVAYGLANLDALLDRRNMEPLPPRRAGVTMEGTQITQVQGAGAAAGLEVGDVVLSVEGNQVHSSRDFTRELQGGAPQKRVLVRRGEQELEKLLDFSGDPEEAKRAARAAARKAAAGG